jgi:hypothetical protein
MPRLKHELVVSGASAALIRKLSRSTGVSTERILENVIKAGVYAVREMYETVIQAEASFDELLKETPEPEPEGHASAAYASLDRLEKSLETTATNGNGSDLPGDTPYDGGATDDLAHAQEPEPAAEG